MIKMIKQIKWRWIAVILLILFAFNMIKIQCMEGFTIYQHFRPHVRTLRSAYEEKRDLAKKHVDRIKYNLEGK